MLATSHRHHARIMCVFIVCGLLADDSGSATEIALSGHLSAIVARQELIDRIEVVFSATETYIPARKPDPSAEAGRRSVVHEGTRVSRHTFRHAGRRAWYEQMNVIKSELEVDQLAPVHQVWAYPSGRVEALRGNTGMIRNSDHLPYESAIDLALGLRMAVAEHWMSDEMWRRCAVRDATEGVVELVLETPEVADPSLGRRHIWSFMPHREYAMVRYLVQSLEDSPRNEAPMYEIGNTDFKLVSGLLLPMTITYRQFYSSADGQSTVVTLAQDLTVEEYTLGKVRDSDEDFLIRWPAGTRVKDFRTGSNYRVETEGLQLTEDYLASLRRGAVAAAGSAGNGVSPRSRLWMLLWANVLLVTAVLMYTAWRMHWKRP